LLELRGNPGFSGRGVAIEMRSQTSSETSQRGGCNPLNPPPESSPGTVANRLDAFMLH